MRVIILLIVLITSISCSNRDGKMKIVNQQLKKKCDKKEYFILVFPKVELKIYYRFYDNIMKNEFHKELVLNKFYDINLEYEDINNLHVMQLTLNKKKYDINRKTILKRIIYEKEKDYCE